MRLLALSDIHNNLVAVRRLRALEANSFDAIAVAGDLGSDAAHPLLAILTTFKCPVVYVYGNWDHKLDYEPSLVPGCQLIHQNVVTIDGFHFTGFSGCPTKWGLNPAAVRLGSEQDASQSVRVLQLNRDALRNVASKLDRTRTIVMTHERLTRMSDLAPDTPLHLFGHMHGFSDTTMGATRFVNVSVLDRPVTARPRAVSAWAQADCRNFNAGNYVIIEIGKSGGVTAKRVALPRDYPDWVALEDVRLHGIEWIPEEAEWTDASDPRLRRYRETLRR